jgi:hypothetical protein
LEGRADVDRNALHTILRAPGGLRGERWPAQASVGHESSWRLDGVSLLGAGMAGSRAMTVLVDDLVPDQLWALVEPLLPAPPRRTAAGTSTPWRLLPARELGSGGLARPFTAKQD